MQLVADIMTRGVATVAPQDSVRQAAQLMERFDVGAVPVCEGDALVGMITDRDITIRVVAAGAAADDSKVADAMTPGVECCFDDEQVDEVMERMRDAQIRRLPVKDHATQQLIGMLSLGDLATRHSAEVDHTLERISTPSEPARPLPS